MEIVKGPISLKTVLNEVRGKNLVVGFVPTMGFLHAGHGSLIETAKVDTDFVVVSIFVNPTQFAKGEDLEKYPRDLKSDIEYLETLGVDLLFVPEAEYLYGQNNEHSTTVSVSAINKVLDGAFRPTHFDGVTTIVAKLLNIVGSCRCFMGMKDAQQVSIVYRMVRELFMDATIVPCPIIREVSNLAMSSRNTYLSDSEREQAKSIFTALNHIGTELEHGNKDIDALLNDGMSILIRDNLEVQYIQLIEFESLKEARELKEGQYVLAIAVVCGTTRLIDNFFVHVGMDNSIYIDRGKVFESSGDE